MVRERKRESERVKKKKVFRVYLCVAHFLPFVSLDYKQKTHSSVPNEKSKYYKHENVSKKRSVLQLKQCPRSFHLQFLTIKMVGINDRVDRLRIQLLY